MAQTDTKYNGWANWATWNVALWFGNEEPLYREICRLARKEPFVPTRAERWTRKLLPNGTPDMDGPKAYKAVDWQEIADCFNGMVSE